MRVLFAPKEISGQMSVLSQTLRDLGVPATSLAFSEHKFGYPIDKTIVLNEYPDFLRKLIRFYVTLVSLLKFDIFHFQAGQSLSRGNRDIPILKFFGKKVLMHFHGSEIRNPEYVIGLGEGRRNLPPIMTAKQVLKLKFLRKYVDKFIVAPSDLLELVPEAAPLPTSVEERWFLPREYQESNEFVVVHSPTSRAIKGTKFVISACESLKKKGYPLKLLLLENVLHEEIRKFYEQADVFVDQLLIGWYGVAAIENMALGNPVVAYINPELRKKYAPDLPIIQANKDNIEEVLESLLKNRKLLAKIGIASKEYAKQSHHPKVNARKLIEIYNSI